MLTASENMDDYKEVTPKERAALELQDASFTEPPKVFIDQWNTACGIWGKYNEETGYFELNGLTDITYEEALRIYEYGAITSQMAAKRYFSAKKLRTNLPITVGGDSNGETAYRFDCLHMIDNSGIEVLNLTTPGGDYGSKRFFSFSSSNNKGTDRVFQSCDTLEKIIGVVSLYGFVTTSYPWRIFGTLPNLEEVSISQLTYDFDITGLSKINLQSVQFLIANCRTSTTVRTVKVHADVYAKMTADETNEAYTSLSDEEKTQWTSLIELAAAKNIQFATS